MSSFSSSSRGQLQDEIALRESGVMEVLTREGSIAHIGTGKWVRVQAELENSVLRLDSSKLSSFVYCKEMMITAGTTVLKAPQQGRPHCISLADFNAASGKKRLLDCGTADSASMWYELLRRVATTDLDTLLEPLREAREKERDAGELEGALASRPARVDAALLALRRGRLDVDYVGRDASERGVTALLAAARAARSDAVEALLGLGAVPDGPHATRQQAARDSLRVEETPLLGAVRNDALKAVLKLLEAGADPTLQDDSRETPLLAAARLGGAKIVTALLKQIALIAANEPVDSRRRDELLSHVDEQFGIDPSTALAAAAAAGHAGAVGALCAGGRARVGETSVTCAATVECRDSEGRTAAHHAAARGRASAVAALADAGADVDAKDADGNTPLQLAAAEGHVATVAALLQRDAAAPLQRQRLPATEAAVRASEVVAVTAELRCALGTAEFDATRAVELAIAVRRVLREGSSESDGKLEPVPGAPYASPDLGRAPIGFRHGQASPASALANFPADVCALPPARQLTALLRCCQNGDGQGVELWLKIGADANHADHDPRERCTPLMACATRGDRHLCKLLLATGRCEVDARDANGATALCRAALAAARSRTVPVSAASARDVATLLLEHGADPLKRDHKDRSPLSIAAADARDVQLVDRMMSTTSSLFGVRRESADTDLAVASKAHRRKISLGGASDVSADDDTVELHQRGDTAVSPSSGASVAYGGGQQGIDVDAPHGKYRSTVLMFAAAVPEASAVLRMLLGAHDLAADAGLKPRRAAPKKGLRTADLRKLDARERTALFYAAEADRAENVELLLNFGRRASHESGDGALGAMLDVDAVDRNGHTALHVATAAHAHGAVGALLRFGASASSTTHPILFKTDIAAGRAPRPFLSPIPDAPTPTASTPGGDTLAEVRSSDVGPVFDEELAASMRAGSDDDISVAGTCGPQAQDASAMRPLSIALDNGDAQIAGTLGRFRAAIVAGDDACTLRYVERGNYQVDEPAGDDHGACTALLVACRLGHAPAAARLLEAGADANKADARGETPLLAAARSGALLDAKVDRAKAAKKQQVPCQVVSLGQLLLDAGADPTAVDSRRRESALHVVAGGSERGAPRFVGGAVRRGEAAALLLSRGADPLALDAAGRTPLLLASGAWPPRDVEDEASFAALGPNSPGVYCRGDALDAHCVLNALLEHHASSPFDLDHRHDTPGSSTITALGAAAVAGRLLAVGALLAAGARPNEPADLDGRSPLALAAEAGHAPIVRALAHVSDLGHVAGASMRTALHDAAATAQTATVSALLTAGAFAETRDGDGAKPLDLAERATTASVDLAQAGGSPGGHHYFDGDERSVEERANAVIVRLSVMRQAVRARLYARAANLAQRGNFLLVDGDGALALESAAREGDADGIYALLEVRSQAPQLHDALGSAALGAAALDAAALHRRATAAVVLLSRGAAPSPHGAAALLALAIDLGDTELLRLSVAAGADAAAPNDAGADVAQDVVSYDTIEDDYPDDWRKRDRYARGHWGADMLRSDDQHSGSVPHLSALARAAAAPPPRGVNMLELLLGDVDIADRSSQKEALHGTMRDALRRAISSAATPGDITPVSPLHAAAAADCFDAVAVIVRFCRAAAAYDAKEHISVSEEALAIHDAPLARDARGRTPLHLAAAVGGYDAVAVLVTLLASDNEAARTRLLCDIDGAGDSPLARAARVDDGAVVSLLLAAGADSAALDREGRSARDIASRSGRARRRLEAMSVAIADGDFNKSLGLVSRGSFSVSARSSNGQTLLVRAAACGRGDCVEAALALGAARRDKVDASAPSTTTTSGILGNERPQMDCATSELDAALSAASVYRQPTTAEALLQARCDVHPRLEDAAPLLRLAVCRRRYELIKLLLMRGAEPLAPCVTTALHDSRPDDGPPRNLSVLPVGDTADAELKSTLTTELTKTPFMLSVSSGDLEAVKIFLDQRVAVFDVDLRDARGTTALMEALGLGHVRVAHALVAAGADAQVTDNAGRSALERACFDEPENKARLREVQAAVASCRRMRGDEEARAAAAAVGTENDKRIQSDEPPAFDDDNDVPEAMPMPKPPKPSSRMQDLLRSSAIAAERKVLKTQISDPLPQHPEDALDSAPVSSGLPRRRRPSDAARGSERSLFQARIDNALALAVALRDAAAVEELLLAGADALAPCTDARRRSDAETALLRACRQPDHATLAALLARTKSAGRVKGFDVDAPHGTVRAAALAVTSASGDAESVKLLIDAGASISRVDANGRGPLWHAASRGHASVVHLLASSLKHCDDEHARLSDTLNAADVAGATPLHAAARVGARAVVSSLLEHGADATIRDAKGHTPRRVALAHGFTAAAAQLDAMSAAIDDGK